MREWACVLMVPFCTDGSAQMHVGAEESIHVECRYHKPTNQSSASGLTPTNIVLFPGIHCASSETLHNGFGQ
jgi:hypothetical protein